MHPPILGFIGYSGTGKTTLLEKLIPILRARGLRIGLIKHSHHNFDIDIPGKDSYRLRKAGASQVMVASKRRWALMTEHEQVREEPVLEELLQHMDTSHLDLILVEGFKHENFPKIELQRRDLNKPPLHPHDSAIVAVANDMPDKPCDPLVLLDINAPVSIADFIMHYLDERD